MSGFSNAWIIILTVVTIVLLVWLSFATRKIKNPRDDNTTGHVYDGIVEEDNPLPAWWFSMFMLTIVFGVGYLLVYPGLGNYKGMLNWTSVDQLERSQQQVADSFQASIQQFSGMSIEEMAGNDKANSMGRRLFTTNCSVCHGREGQGGFGFPNLADSEWQWGGSIDQIMHSIVKGRQAVMAPWAQVLGAENLPKVVTYVRHIAGLEPDADAATVEAGKQQFSTYCVACHGPDATGNPVFGAPSLVDDVWLYGNSRAEIQVSISAGRNGQMPAHEELLSQDKINLIAAYVLSLSSDKPAAAIDEG